MNISIENYIEERIFDEWIKSGCEDDKEDKNNFSKDEVINLLKDYKRIVEKEFEDNAEKERVRKSKHVCSMGYECYICIGQEKEFEETYIHLNAYSMGMYSMFKGAFEKYEPLMKMCKKVIEDIEKSKINEQ